MIKNLEGVDIWVKDMVSSGGFVFMIFSLRIGLDYIIWGSKILWEIGSFFSLKN